MLVAEDAVRRSDPDDREPLLEAPLLAYVDPGGYVEISEIAAVPFHAGRLR